MAFYRKCTYLSENAADQQNFSIIFKPKPYCFQDPVFAAEEKEPNDEADSVGSEKNPANSLAKGRKLMSMAHHKLW